MTSTPSIVTTAAFQYDSDGELKSLAHTDASGSALTSYNWTYDKLISVAESTAAVGGQVFQQIFYNYEVCDQRVGETVVSRHGMN